MSLTFGHLIKALRGGCKCLPGTAESKWGTAELSATGPNCQWKSWTKCLVT